MIPVNSNNHFGAPANPEPQKDFIGGGVVIMVVLVNSVDAQLKGICLKKFFRTLHCIEKMTFLMYRSY